MTAGTGAIEVPAVLRRSLTGRGAAVVLLAGFWLALIGSLEDKCATFDEVVHVTAGTSYWRYGDFRLDPENGNLPQHVGGLGPVAIGADFPDIRTPPAKGLWEHCRQYPLAYGFLYSVGNDPARMLRAARAAMALLAVALGAVVYAWSRRMFGPEGGILSLLVYVLDPNMLAHGALVASDLAGALFFVASLGCFWRMLHRITWGSVLAAAGTMAGLFLSKMSSPLVLPMIFVLVALRLMWGGPLRVRLVRRCVEIERRARMAGAIAGAMLVQALLVIVVIWGCYGFRYRMSDATHGEATPTPSWEALLDPAGVSTSRDGLTVAALEGVRFAREHHLLPEAFLYGHAYVHAHAVQRLAFLNGEVRFDGFRNYFPYVFLVKTPLGLLLVLLLAAAGALARGRTLRTALATAPLWVLIVVYGAAAIRSNLNIGLRHLLPVYPALFVLAGAAGWWLRPAEVARPRFRPTRAVLLTVVLLMAAETAWTWPNYLAYFNGIVRPRDAYKHLVDSSLDWGQDLPALRRHCDAYRLERPDREVYLAYFGTGNPDHHGIRAERLPGTGPTVLPPPERLRLRAGRYYISATMLQPLMLGNEFDGSWCRRLEARWQAFGPLAQRLRDPGDSVHGLRDVTRQEVLEYVTLRFARLRAFLRERQPVESVNHSILVYDLGEEDLRRLLLGPPPPFGPDLLESLER